MNFNYWIGGFSRIAANLTGDFRRGNEEPFVFTKRLLRTGYEFDTRPRAKSTHFLDLFPGAEEINVPLGEVRYIRSNATPTEVHCLACIARLTMPKRIFEFGTFDGATTILLASACPAAEVFTLDLDCGSVNATQPAAIKAEVDNVLNGGIGSRIAGNPAAGRIHQLVGDSASFDYTQYHNSIDLAFIDACHDYAYVKSDTANALRMVPRGIIVWHDYNPGWPGVISAVDELLPKHRITHIAGTTLAVLDRSGE